jgi:hypothetical protein
LNVKGVGRLKKVEERGYKVYRVQKPVILAEYCCLAGGRY